MDTRLIFSGLCLPFVCLYFGNLFLQNLFPCWLGRHEAFNSLHSSVWLLWPVDRGGAGIWWKCSANDLRWKPKKWWKYSAGRQKLRHSPSGSRHRVEHKGQKNSSRIWFNFRLLCLTRWLMQAFLLFVQWSTSSNCTSFLVAWLGRGRSFEICGFLLHWSSLISAPPRKYNFSQQSMEF